MVTDSRCTGRSLFVLTLEFTYKRVFKGERENLSIDSFTLGLSAKAIIEASLFCVLGLLWVCKRIKPVYVTTSISTPASLCLNHGA